MFRILLKYSVFIALILHSTSILSQDGSPWFVTDTSYNEMLSQAISFQARADSLMSIAFGHRKEILYMADSEKKGRLQGKVTRIEREAEQLQEWADDIFSNLPVQVGEEQERRDSLLILDTVINDIRVYHYNLAAMAEQEEPGERAPAAGEPEREEKDEAAGNHFLIHKESPYSDERPFEHSFALPDGPFYRIQMAAYGNPVGYDFFGGISPVTTELTDKGITRYYAGKFVSFEAAGEAIKRLRALGYDDAFIVGYFNGRRMAPERVREYERIN